ncbi:MAG: helix-turn-helix domain-containing protein [Verrucomicrobia bacterium]|nr:helix-turn-helix domain-containing protein [Verrucomicrobiota bacterium]
MQTIGERLEEARKKKGISIREAAEATKIRGDYLQKFEGNHFDIGLTEIYTRGFLRNYANFLKLPADRILNDYSALGRGEPRPRQPSREVYGRMDISVASAGEPSDRAAPPAEGAAEAEPVRAQPRYPRGGTNLPSGPDPAVVFKYAKLGGAGVVVILALWLASSFIFNRTAKPSAASQTPALPPVATQPAANVTAVVTALDVVRVQIWAKDETAPPPTFKGREVLAPVTLAKGGTASFEKNGPVIIYASAQENIRIDFSGKQFIPGAPPSNARGAAYAEIP